MNREIVLHLTIKNYEASRDGVVRHCRLKKPVGYVNNSGYLRFRTEGKSYNNHRFVYGCFFGEIPKGLVIDYVDGNNKNNSVNNLRVITQRENCLLGNTGRCKTVGKRIVKSINVITAEEITFQSINAAGKYFGINSHSVQFVADKVTKSALSKNFNKISLFSYSVLDTEDTSSRDV